jgi:hypothetical protein
VITQLTVCRDGPETTQNLKTVCANDYCSRQVRVKSDHSLSVQVRSDSDQYTDRDSMITISPSQE